MRRLLPLLLLAFGGVPASGQSLSDRFNGLFTFGDCGQPLCLDVNSDVHGDHYNPSAVQGENDLLAFITNSIGLTVSQIPFAAATGGVTYTFEGGVPLASSVSAGPIFADRAETLGRSQLLFGANVTGASFTEIRGVALDNLLLRFTHEDVIPINSLGEPIFERDYIAVNTNLDLSLLVTSIFAAYGVSDRVDIGIAVPIVRSSMSGRSQAVICQYVPGSPISSCNSTPNSPHSFGTPANRTVTAQAETEGTATGLGDIAARVKAHVYQGPTVGLALIGDLRLATGRSEDFLGSGATSLRIFGAASARYEAFSPHVNAGFQYTSADWATTRVLGTAGFDYLLGEQVTLAAELMTNLELGDSKLQLPEPVVYTTPDPVEDLRLTDIPDRNDNFVDAAIGAKIQAGTQLRLVTNIVVPLAKAGLRPGVTWTVGFEVSR